MRYLTVIAIAALCACSPHKPLDLPSPDDGDTQTEETDEGFSIRAEVYTGSSAGRSVLSISLTSGDGSLPYTGKVLLDGAPLDGGDIAIDFSSSPVRKVDLPVRLLPGTHTVRAEVTCGDRTESAEVSFEEPVRHPVLMVTIDQQDGYTCVSVADNIYSLELAVTDRLTVRGECTYQYCAEEGHTETTTVQKTLEDNVFLPEFVPEGGTRYRLANRGALEDELTSCSMDNYCWKKSWVMESEGYWEWKKEYLGRTYYRLTSTREEISAAIKAFGDVTVKVHCYVDGVSWNGQPVDKGIYSYQIQ